VGRRTSLADWRLLSLPRLCILPSLPLCLSSSWAPFLYFQHPTTTHCYLLLCLPHYISGICAATTDRTVRLSAVWI